MSVILTIKKQDGSVYWVSEFADQPTCDKWLAEEKTRPYWQKSFVTSVAPGTPDAPPLDPIEEKAKLDKMAAAKVALSTIDKSLIKPADIPTILEQVAVALGLK